MITLHKIAKVIEHFTGKQVAEEVVVSHCNDDVTAKFHTHAFIVQLNYADGSECPETTGYSDSYIRNATYEDYDEVFTRKWLEHKLAFQALPDEYFASNILGLSNAIHNCQSNLSSHNCNDATREKLEFCLKTKKLHEAWREVRKFSMLSEEEQELRGVILGLWLV